MICDEKHWWVQPFYMLQAKDGGTAHQSSYRKKKQMEKGPSQPSEGEVQRPVRERIRRRFCTSVWSLGTWAIGCMRGFRGNGRANFHSGRSLPGVLHNEICDVSHGVRRRKFGLTDLDLKSLFQRA